MYWLIAAALLFIIEMFTGTFYLLVISASFASAGLAQWLFDTSLATSIVIAVICSVISIILVRYWQKNYHVSQKPNITDLDKNQFVTLQQPLPGDLWLVRYRGTEWQAKFIDKHPSAQKGDGAYICRKTGNLLLISPSRH